jgi:hypothetical protein
MQSQHEYLPVLADNLPSRPGILMVCCPLATDRTTSKILALVECENVRDQAANSSIGWASNCSTGFLEYLVAEISDPQVRVAELNAVAARNPVGSTVSRL